MSGPAGPYPPDQVATDPAEAIEAALDGLDEDDPGAAHAEAFEAVNAAILAELRRLEAL